MSTGNSPSPQIPEPYQRIIEARHHDPFEVLGRHSEGERTIVRAFLPKAKEVRIAETGIELERVPNTDLFVSETETTEVAERYQLDWTDAQGQVHRHFDPYCFPPQIGDLDLHLFGEGKHWHAHRLLGAREHHVDGVAGVLFSVWAPHAERVSVVGDFNDWDTAATPMKRNHSGGDWSATVVLEAGQRYRFRYLLDGKEWTNDWYADDYEVNAYGSCDSVVDLTDFGVLSLS